MRREVVSSRVGRRSDTERQPERHIHHGLLEILSHDTGELLVLDGADCDHLTNPLRYPLVLHHVALPLVGGKVVAGLETSQSHKHGFEAHFHNVAAYECPCVVRY